MNSLLTVIKAMLEILASQQAQIKALQREVKMDNEVEFNEDDFADLNSRIEALSGITATDTANLLF